MDNQNSSAHSAAHYHGMPQQRSIVNVASVRQLSPFRYPGGKTWLVPEIRKWLSQKPRPSRFVELFAGGAIIGLTVAAEGLADHVILVEIDPDVAAVWETIFHGDAERLTRRILGYELTVQNVQETVTATPTTTCERAFRTILRNRTRHGGILAPGSGLLKRGENGRGLGSRWYPETLTKRIRKLVALRGRVTFVEGDGLNFLRQSFKEPSATYFIDPPYAASGQRGDRRLYAYSEIDHEALFDLCMHVAGNFMLTYDDARGVIEMAEQRGFHVKKVAMKNARHARMYELLITPGC